jgi:hypothetical protein
MGESQAYLRSRHQRERRLICRMVISEPTSLNDCHRVLGNRFGHNLQPHRSRRIPETSIAQPHSSSRHTLTFGRLQPPALNPSPNYDHFTPTLEACLPLCREPQSLRFSSALARFALRNMIPFAAPHHLPSAQLEASPTAQQKAD